MKILIVNTYDASGGAARAAYRLHCALLAGGVKSSMLVQKKQLDDDSVICGLTKFQKIVSLIKPYIDQFPTILYKNKAENLFSSAWFSFGDILNHINDIQPDLVHLNWICKGMLSVEELGRIKVPIVWTMHDSWPFTGGCHIPGDCRNYIETCGNCPSIRSNCDNDLSRKNYKIKQRTYSKKRDITIVAVSKWLLDCAKSSSLLRGTNLVCIPNAIDTKTYKPLNKKVAKAILNIDVNKRIILFGAMSATSDLNKGYKELIEAIDQLTISDFELIVFGGCKPTILPTDKCRIHYVGHLKDDISLNVVYSAADVMVVPSRFEAFGQTASEAMACGTPVVAFNTTGLIDIVDHKINGYLAKPFDTNDLSKGIEWVLSHESFNQLSENARNKVVKMFDGEIVAAQYMSLYKEVLNSNSRFLL